MSKDTNDKKNPCANDCIRREPQRAGADCLVQSEHGITPGAGVGADVVNRPHIHPQRYVRGTEIEYRGKKHIDPHHMDLSDDFKREQGRCGKKRVFNASTAKKDSVFNLLAPCKADESPVECGVRQTNKNINTSIQLARARLLEISQNPQYREAARELLRHPWDASIVQKEERLSRRVRAVEYAKGSGERCAKLQEHKKASDLGAPSETMQMRVPFAFDVSTPRPDNAPLSRGCHYRNVESQPAPVNFVSRSRGDALRRALHDNVVLSQNQYPDPPAVGVRATPRASLRRNVLQTQPKMSLEEETLRRSRARCHQSASSRMPDFIFGQPPPLETPRVTLRSATEERWKAEEDRVARRRTGRAMAHVGHQPTALW